MRSPHSTAWSEKLKQSYLGGDPGLTYLWEARNALDHGLGGEVEFTPRTTEVAGFLTVQEGPRGMTMISDTKVTGPSGTTIIHNLAIHGHDVVAYSGTRDLPVIQQEASARLLDIYSDKKKKTFSVPTSIDGEAISPGSPLELAVGAAKFLDKMVEDLKQWFPNP